MTGGGLAGLAAALGHDFTDTGRLGEALTHGSLQAGRRPQPGPDYQRLEFLGDRVLSLVVAEWLLERFPAEPEGALDRRHSALVRREALADAATRIDLGRHLQVIESADGAAMRSNPAVLADALEAVIAALYLDGGLAPVRRFIRRMWEPLLQRDDAPPRDVKNTLQEWAQGRGRPLPRYEMVGRSGPDHDPVFEVKVTVDGVGAATGAGPNKQAAEKAAAARLLAAVGA